MIAVIECERCPADLNLLHRRGIELQRRVRRPGHRVDLSGIDLRRDPRRHDHQPQRIAVDVVGVPGAEERGALVIQVDAPSRFRTRRRRPPQVLIVGGRGEVRLRAPGAARHRRRECLSRDRPAAVHAIDDIVEGAAVVAGKGQLHRSDCRLLHVLRSERRGEERGTRRTEQQTRIDVRRRSFRLRREPQRRSVDVVGEPGNENDVALMGEIDAPAGLRPRWRTPPDTLVISGWSGRRDWHDDLRRR